MMVWNSRSKITIFFLSLWRATWCNQSRPHCRRPPWSHKFFFGYLWENIRWSDPPPLGLRTWVPRVILSFIQSYIIQTLHFFHPIFDHNYLCLYAESLLRKKIYKTFFIICTIGHWVTGKICGNGLSFEKIPHCFLKSFMSISCRILHNVGLYLGVERNVLSTSTSTSTLTSNIFSSSTPLIPFRRAVVGVLKIAREPALARSFLPEQ